MGKGQKIITVALWAILVTALVGVVAGKLFLGRPATSPPVASPTGEALPTMYPAADFSLIDQDGKPFASTQLGGRPWVCGFMFTTCGDVCPKMTAEMVRLQPELPPGVDLVSFTVNPEHDTPAVLKEYAATWKADTSRWHFLTGTPDQMFAVAAGMKMAAKPAEGETPILHDRRLILIDARGMVRGFYSSADEAAMARLAVDATRLAAEAPAAPSPSARNPKDGPS